MSQVMATQLHSVIEFDSPFTVAPGGNVFQPLFGIHAPSVRHDKDFDYIVDDVCPIDSIWQAFSVGYTGQHGYNGAVMHASEYLGGRLAEDILNTPGTYVVCAVEVDCSDEDETVCYDTVEDVRDYGCDCAPAGWIVLKFKN